MKNIAFLTILILLFSIGSLEAFAQTPTPRSTTPLPTNEKKTEALSDQINDLKEKIASRVAQLDLVEKRAISGKAEKVDDTQITLTDIYGNTRLIDVDEITEFSSSDDDSFGISDIDTGDEISVLGLYNKQSERILARFIEDVNLPSYIAGKIQSINEDDFTVVVETADGQSITVNVETSTTTREYDGEDFIKSGFSKFTDGQQVFVTGYPSEDDEKTISANRVLIYAPTSAESPSPSPEDE